MSVIPVNLPGVISLILTPAAITRLDRGVTPLFDELNGLARAATLPARLEVSRNGARVLVLYLLRHSVRLYLSQDEDSYSIAEVRGRQFRDEAHLTERALLVGSAYGFVPYMGFPAFNQAYQGRRHIVRTGHWNLLWQHWTVAEPSSAPAHPLPPGHEDYLDLLERVVEATREIEIEKLHAAPAMPYVRVDTTQQPRFSGRGVYDFRLARTASLSLTQLVYVDGQPSLRGRVVHVDDHTVTVRFEPGLDYRQLRHQGALRRLPSDRVFRAQQEAIELFREGRAANPALLATLVDGLYQRYQPGQDKPETELDTGQLEAFRRALEVPDVLTVLGPPGTGKTTTIVEVVLASAARRRPVLVSAHTNRALDNVLAQLPPQINAIRVGNEDSMTEQVRRISLDARVDSMRAEIRQETVLLDLLEGFEQLIPEFDRQSDRLLPLLDGLAEAERRFTATENDLRLAVRAASGSPVVALDRAIEGLASAGQRRSVAEANLIRAQRQSNWAQRAPLSGLWGRWLWRWFDGRVTARQQASASAVAAEQEAEAAHERSWLNAALATAGDPAVRRAELAREGQRQWVSGAWAQLRSIAGYLRAMLSRLVAVPADPSDDLAEWRSFRSDLVRSRTELAYRAGLIREWRTKVADISSGLQAEALRYADVVGATCIGAATTGMLTGIEFDLVIIDEAGQIGLPNLLVPLTRGRRAMLVGDHHQLPPFLDEDVKRWAQGLARTGGADPQQLARITTLLRQSGFEQLFPHAPRDNAVPLLMQRRMPPVIAEFVSTSFYGGTVRTSHPGTRPDPLFPAPFAMVDTSDQPYRRREQPHQRTELWGRAGYTNALEVEIICALVAYYRRAYGSWAVIVPYNAQLDLISEGLATALGTSRAVSGNVGTVDEFQGGQCNLIIFGFTRSNDRGEIGFLNELRRFNVAISRAQQQLVMVGDTELLTSAKDPEFRNLMRSMTSYLGRLGSIKGSQDVQGMMGRRAP